MSKLSLTKYKIILFFFAFFLIFVRALLVPASDNDARSFLIGDGVSDFNTLSAVRYFHDFGLWKSKLRPIHGYTGNENDPSVHAYTHSPSFPDFIQGAWSLIINSTNEFSLRTFSIFFSILWFILIIHFHEKLLPSKNEAFLATAVLVLSNYFIAWADNLHAHMWLEFLKFVMLIGLLRF
jgi:hypothetical protein